MSISKKLWKSSSTPRKAIFTIGFCIVALISVITARGWGPPWLLASLVIIAVSGPIILKFWNDRLTARDKARTEVDGAILTVQGEKGVAPKVGQLTLSDFGVHVALENVCYITRRAETELLDAIRMGIPVLLLGPSLAGKSRMGAEVLQAEFPERDIIVPDVPDGLATILASDHLPEGSVVWLDDLERYISDPRHFKTQWLTKLRSHKIIIVATMRETAYEYFQPTSDQTRDQWELLNQFQKVRIREDDEERRELAAAIESSKLKAGVLRYGLGTYIGGGHIALERFHTGKVTHPLGVAIIQAAVGWQLSGAGRAIPREVAKQVVPSYLTPEQIEDDLEDFESAIRWATEWCAGLGSFRMLYPVHEKLRPFDYIVDYLSNNKLIIPDALWKSVINTPAPPNKRLAAGVSALRYGRKDVAYTLFYDAAESGDARGMANIGVMLKQNGHTAAAEGWFERSAALDDEYGMNGLGLIYEERGDGEEAEKLFRKAGEKGYGTAINNLGRLLSKDGQKDEAEVLFKQSADMNNGWGMANWGLVLAERGRNEQAENLFRRAAALGNPAGMYEFGVLLEQQGQQKAAEEFYRKSAHMGFPAGQSALGVYLTRHGQDKEAEFFLKAAAAQNDPDALYNLGVYFNSQDNFNEAEKAFRQASELGHPSAMNNLGVLLGQKGLTDEAKSLYRRSAKANHVEAMHNLAVILEQKQDTEAEEWLRRAVDAGFAPSMIHLGFHELERDNLEGAAELYQRALDLGLISGLTSLGTIYYLQGDLKKAEATLREAAASGDSAAKHNLTILLREL